MTVVGGAPTPVWQLSYSPAGVSHFPSFIHALISSVWPPSRLKSPAGFSLSPSFCLFIKATSTSPAGEEGGGFPQGCFGTLTSSSSTHPIMRWGQQHLHSSFCSVGGNFSANRTEAHASAASPEEQNKKPKSSRENSHARRHVSIRRSSLIVDARLDASAAARIALPSSIFSHA